MTSPIRIRPATPDDIPEILRLIKELATYEKEPEQAVATDADLQAALFGADANAGAILAQTGEEYVGLALFFHNFSTWTGKRGLYLEDLYVRESYRGKGVGIALLKHLAGIAVERSCGRFEWSVLDWNQSAIDFYESIGARPMQGWTVYRLDGDPLAELARE